MWFRILKNTPQFGTLDKKVKKTYSIHLNTFQIFLIYDDGLYFGYLVLWEFYNLNYKSFDIISL